MRKIGRGVKRKIKIQVVELKYSRVMENKFLGIRASQKSYPIKKVCLAFVLFLSPNARIHEKASRTARVGKSFFKR